MWYLKKNKYKKEEKQIYTVLKVTVCCNAFFWINGRSQGKSTYNLSYMVHCIIDQGSLRKLRLRVFLISGDCKMDAAIFSLNSKLSKQENNRNSAFLLQYESILIFQEKDISAKYILYLDHMHLRLLQCNCHMWKLIQTRYLFTNNWSKFFQNVFHAINLLT